MIPNLIGRRFGLDASGGFETRPYMKTLTFYLINTLFVWFVYFVVNVFPLM
jgi:hypothetical protein